MSQIAFDLKGWAVLDVHYACIRPYLSQTIRKSPDTPDKSGEICFGLVKYFIFFLINIFKLLQKYKNVW